jgi:hypothetical protein
MTRARRGGISNPPPPLSTSGHTPMSIQPRGHPLTPIRSGFYEKKGGGSTLYPLTPTSVLPCHPPHPVHPQIPQRRGHHHHAHRKPAAPVRQRKVHVVSAHALVGQHREDRHERSQKERRHSRRHAHQQGSKPPQVAQRNPPQHPIPPRPRNIIRRCHLI